MTIFVYKGFDQESGNRKYPVSRLSNLKRQGRVSDIEFDISVFNEKFFDAAKCFVVVFCISASYLTMQKKKKIRSKILGFQLLLSLSY